MRNRFDRALDALTTADTSLPEYFHDAAQALAVLFPHDTVGFVHFKSETEPGRIYGPSAATSLPASQTAPLELWPHDETTQPCDDAQCRQLLLDLPESPSPVTALMVPLRASDSIDSYLVVLRDRTPHEDSIELSTDFRVAPLDPVVSRNGRGARAISAMPSTRKPNEPPSFAARIDPLKPVLQATRPISSPNTTLPVGWHAHEHGAASLLARYIQTQLRMCLLQLSLAEAEDLRSIAFRYIDQGIFILRPDLTILAANPAGAALGELEVDQLIGNRLVDLGIQMWLRPGVPLPVDEIPVIVALRENRTVVSDMLYVTTASGVELWARLSATPTLNAQGEPVVVVVTRDLTEEQRMVQALKRREAQLLAAQELAKLELWSWDAANNQIVFDAFQSDVLREFAPKGRVSTEMFLAAAGVGSEIYGQILLKVLIEGQRCNFDFQFDRADGGKNTWRVWIIPELDENGNVIDVWGTGLDITHEREVQSELQRLAMQDALTSLANRAHLHSSLVDALARTTETRFTALIMIDLDDFKGVNDTYGHNAGDDLLQQVAERIQQAAPLGSTTSRLGGDEFVILVEGLKSTTEAADVATKVHRSLQVPFFIQDARQALAHFASIGVATTNQENRLVDDFMRDADLAMYDAKSKGGNHLVIFDESLREAADQRHLAESIIKTAFAGNRVEGRFQATRRVSDGALIGVEVVACIQSPEDGMWNIVDFPRIAEDAELGAAIDAVVLKDACKALREWPTLGRERLGTLNMMAANMSPLTLEVPDAWLAIKDELRGIDNPEQFTLEISAHTKTSSDPLLIDRLAPLKQLGIKLCLDDFGVGYSSFSHLQHRGVDFVKLDASYVSGITQDPDAVKRLQAMVDMCATFERPCVINGVDTQEQLDLLRTMNVEYVHGEIVGAPLTWGEFKARYLS